MRLKYHFRTRKDLDFWMVYFEVGDTLEMSPIQALLTELLRVHRTRDELETWIQEFDPSADPNAEIDEIVKTYTDLELLDDI